MLSPEDASRELQEARRNTALHLRTHFAVEGRLQESNATRLALMLQDGVRVYQQLLVQLGCAAEEEECTSLLGVQQLCVGQLPRPDSAGAALGVLSMSMQVGCCLDFHHDENRMLSIFARRGARVSAAPGTAGVCSRGGGMYAVAWGAIASASSSCPGPIIIISCPGPIQRAPGCAFACFSAA
jgi:hypothetical protein